MNILDIKQESNKVIISGEGFELLKKLDNLISSMNEKIENNNKFIWEGGKLNEKQQKIFEELKDEYLLLKNVHDKFNPIITEHSIILFYLQKIANTFEETFPVEIKTGIMPSQVKRLEEIRQEFLGIKEVFNQYRI